MWLLLAIGGGLVLGGVFTDVVDTLDELFKAVIK